MDQKVGKIILSVPVVEKNYYIIFTTKNKDNALRI